MDAESADWLPRRQAALPPGVVDARTLLLYLADGGQPLSAFRAAPGYPALLRRHPWLADVRQR